MMSRPFRLAASVSLTCLLMAGCAERPEPLPATLPGPDHAGDAAPRVDSTVRTRTGSPGLASYGRADAAGGPGAEGGAGDITLNFAGTDIRAVVNQILGDTLHVNYAIDPNVTGTATLRTTTPLRRDQLLPVLRSLLAGSNAALVEEGGIYHVVSSGGGGGGIGVGVGASPGTSAIALRYASAVDLAQVLKPFQPPGGQIGADASANTIIVTGDPATRATLTDLVRSFDVDTLAGQSYALLPTTTGSAAELAQALEKALGSGQGGARASQIQVVPMARIDSVLVITRSPALLSQSRRLFSLIESGRRATVRNWTVYYLQNNRANDVAYVLQQAFTPDHVTAQPTQGHNASTQSGFGSPDSGGGGGTGESGGGMGGGGFGSSFGGGSQSSGNNGAGGISAQGANPQGGATQAAGGSDSIANNPLLGGLGNASSGSSGGRSDTVRIIPDTQNNAVLVYATANEGASIAGMLHKIDIMPLQVRIDATIAEVTLNDALQYGTQFFFKSGGVNGVLSTGNQMLGTASLATAALNSSFPGFVLGGLSGGGAPFVINLLQNVTQVQVLSSPQLMVTDNQPASLMVGNYVPYLSGTTTGILTTNSTITNQIQYHPTGVILQITPRISNGDMVTLDISQQVSAVASNTTTAGNGTINSPTFTQRQVTSRVTVGDGQTIGLAGLITDNRQRANSGLPWLKDIPILGALGSTQNNSRARTELLVLVTPHVVHSQLEAHNLTEDLRDHLLHAANLPDTMGAIPPTGSFDPQSRVLKHLGLRD